MNIQGVQFNWNPPKFSKYNSPCKLAQNFSTSLPPKMLDIVKEFGHRLFRGGGDPVNLDTMYHNAFCFCTVQFVCPIRIIQILDKY